MLVVFDTNIWKSDLYLRSRTSSAVKAYLNLSGARIGLPEVVEMEMKRHLLADLKSYRDRVQDNHERLLALFNQLKEVVLPTDDDIQRLVSDSINSVGIPFQKVPFSIDAARASFHRTIDKRRPSHKNQQFKDGVLWEDCKLLAKQESVILVTNDRAFFQDDNLEKGIASDLAREIADEGIELKVLPSLTALLHEIREPVQTPKYRLEEALEEQLGNEFDSLCDKQGFNREKEIDFKVEYFATENPAILYVHVDGSYHCTDILGSKRSSGTLFFSCDGSFRVMDKVFIDLSLTELGLKYRDADGQENINKGAYIRAGGIVIGHRTVEHQIREPLD